MTQLIQLNEVGLQYKYKAPITAETPIVTGPNEAFQLFMQYWEDDIIMIERSKALLLDNKNRVIGLLNLSQGGINGTVIDARILFATAVLALPAGIILAHNHPSEDVYPSSTDVKMTKMLKRIGNDLLIPIIDHLIISPNKFYSFTSDQIITP